MRLISLTLLVGVSLFMACKNEPANSNMPIATTTTPNAPNSRAPKEMPEPPFVQEGVLDFYGPNGKSIHRISIEVAANSDERQQGLMWRKSMGDDQGMLFIFEYAEPQSFWMRNTYIPLDIIYVSDKLEVVSIQKNCAILNDKPLPSKGAAQYVIEINGGLSDKKGIQPGTKVGWANDITNEVMGGFKR
jgi:uncharacterized protein